VKVYLETMGCQMNRLDSELVAGALRAGGHELVARRDGADVVLYNTCCVRGHAEDKVCSRLGAERRRKAAGRRVIVGVLGCMAQRLGEGLRRRWPHVEIVCAPGRLSGLAEMIAAAQSGRPAVALDPSRDKPPDAAAEADMDRMDLGRDPRAARGGAQAYLRVMRGCDKFCTYCIVPFVRGRERSRDPDQIVAEAQRLTDAGRSEITLLGQTVNSYRWRAGERSVRFSDLLERVAAVRGLRRLRFVTCYPAEFGRDILEAMRGLPNVCEYIHLPAQSGSDAVLRRMGRRYTRAAYDELVDRARQIVPGVVLAGDFIVGFPGETEADHEASADLIRRSGYKNSFIFKYSPRPGTAAARWADDVPVQVKKRRNRQLLAVQAEAGLAHHTAQVGRTCEVLVEGPSPRVDKQAKAPSPEAMQLVGRTRGDHVVVFDGPAGMIGRYVYVRIAAASALTLFGALCEEGA
jgi:tRNA-2-methylthio-N6-dimethylallyladenosine synthase